MRKERHTKRRDRVLLRMSKGDTLCCQTNADETQWWLEPSGKTVGPVTASKIVNYPGVEPLNDALFEGMSQSYRYVSQGS